MRPSVSQTLLLFTAFTSSSTALQALTNSPCAVQCGNTLGSTSGADIVCQNSDYGSPAGIVFQNCISCQMSSTYVDPVTNQTDLQWALYNLRYAISWCLFGYPDNPSVGDTPCTTSFACGPIQNAFEFDSLSPNVSVYNYCALVPNASVPKCSSCLGQQTDEYYLTNFLTALDGACLQQPTSGKTVSLQGSLFSKTPVNITTPSATPQSTDNQPTGGLTLGAKVGIAVAAILVALGTAGFCIICLGRRRRRKALAKHQQETGYATWLAEQQGINRKPGPSMSMSGAGDTSAGGFHDSPQSQRPLFPGPEWTVGQRDVYDNPQSATGENTYFSPYSSQYSSPVSAQDQVHVIGREWPTDRKGSVTGSSSGLGRSVSMEKHGFDMHGERIEMQNVPPVLLHPGMGRIHHGALGEDDARRGQAL